MTCDKKHDKITSVLYYQGELCLCSPTCQPRKHIASCYAARQCLKRQTHCASRARDNRDTEKYGLHQVEHDHETGHARAHVN